MISTPRRTASVLAAFALLALPCAAGDWPHLRGPNLDGRVTTGRAPAADALALEPAWTGPLGPGYSGVAVAEGFAVTLYSDGSADLAAAFDAETGKQVWSYRIADTYKGHDGSDDGPLSTPVISDGAVYGLGPKGQLFALRLRDGKELWKKTLTADFGAEAPDYGFATTPLVEDGVLIVQTGGSNGRAISGLDRRTGKLLWSRGDDNDKMAYQSPSVLELGGTRQVVAISEKSFYGLAPRTGDVLWRHELGEKDWVGSSVPAYAGESRFMTAVGGEVGVFEVKKAPGGGFEVAELFRTKELGGTYALPVYHDGYLYGFRSQFLTCVDAGTGERVWKSRPPGGRGLILVDGRLVVFGAEGTVVVAAASPEGYHELARLKALEGSGYTWPSFAAGKVFVRNLETLAAISLVERAAASRPAVAAAAEPEHEFGRFVRGLAEAPDKAARIEAFLGAQPGFPVMEGPFAHFVYRGEAEDVAISGSMIESGNPEPMERVEGTDLYHRSYGLEPGVRYEYHFIVNYDERMADPLNARRVPASGMENEVSELHMPGYEAPAHIAEPAGGRRGTLETLEVKSELLEGERKVTVYLPPGYAESERSYPLLVVHQGNEWLEKGLMANTLDNLIGSRVAPVVVAFVDPARAWWTEAGGRATEEYVRMLAEELVPMLNAKYRLLDDPRARAMMGTRYYAVPAALVALRHPSLFGNVAVQSAALGLGSDDALMQAIRTAKPQDVRFYLDWNRFEARSIDSGIDLGEDARVLRQALEQAGFRVAGGEALDSHGWASWRARTDRILETFFPAKPAQAAGGV